MRSQFLCDRYECKISPEACAARQERAHRETYESELNLSLEPCFNCEQGKNQRLKLKAESNGEGAVSMETELKYPCRECGEKEAILSKTTGRPLMHGLCKECFGDKIRAAAEKKRDRIAESYKAGNEEEITGQERRDKALEAYRLGKEKESPKANASLLITLDFTDHPRMLEAIRIDAAQEFRTVEQQIMWDVFQVSKGRPVQDPADL